MYLLKVNNRNTITRCEIYSQLTRKTQNDVIYLVLMSLLLTLNIFTPYCTVSVVNFEHVIASWWVKVDIIKPFTSLMTLSSCSMWGYCFAAILGIAQLICFSSYNDLLRSGNVLQCFRENIRLSIDCSHIETSNCFTLQMNWLVSRCVFV